MRSKILAAVTLCLATLVAAPTFAFAAPTAADTTTKTHRAEKDKAQYPMPAAAYQQKVNERMAKARTRMEKYAAKLDAEKAKEVRAKFDAGVANVNAEVAKATADGTVTKEEAQKVREAVRAMHPHGGKHARAKKGDAKK